jgi:hypothetical protein
MNPKRLDLIQEIDQLWSPVYPYLTKQILEVYGRRDGDVIEIGPFCGVIFALLRVKIGNSFFIATFPPGMGHFFSQEAKKQKLEDKIRVIETSPSLVGVAKNRFDLVIFRGAFFFPSLFEVNFRAIDRILRKDGLALLGGGFGKFTPESAIKKIGKRSRDLNLAIGKVEVDRDQLWRDIQKKNVKGKCEIISEGGLWVVIRK